MSAEKKEAVSIRVCKLAPTAVTISPFSKLVTVELYEQGLAIMQ